MWHFDLACLSSLCGRYEFECTSKPSYSHLPRALEIVLLGGDIASQNRSCEVRFPDPPHLCNSVDSFSHDEGWANGVMSKHDYESP